MILKSPNRIPPPANAGNTRDLGGEDSLEKEIATHSSILAWERGAGELQSMGHQRVGHDWMTEHALIPSLIYSLMSTFFPSSVPWPWGQPLHPKEAQFQRGWREFGEALMTGVTFNGPCMATFPLYQPGSWWGECFPGGSVVKNLSVQTEETGSIPGWEDPTSCGPTKPGCHSHWTCALEPGTTITEALEPVLSNKRNHQNVETPHCS